MLLVGAPLIVVALLAGCSSSQSTDGPLGDGGTPGAQCVKGDLGKPRTMGIFDLDDRGSAPVKITAITLPDAKGLRMTSAWLIPIDYQGGDEILVGAGGSFPPVWRQWADREPLIGAVIRPRQDLNLVFGLVRTTARAGTSDGPKISYSSGGSRYTVTEQTTLEVAAHCS